MLQISSFELNRKINDGEPLVNLEIIDDFFYISSSPKFKALNFIKCNFKGSVDIGPDLEKAISFHQCCFQKPSNYASVSGENISLIFYGCTLLSDFTFYEVKISLIHFNDCRKGSDSSVIIGVFNCESNLSFYNSPKNYGKFPLCTTLDLGHSQFESNNIQLHYIEAESISIWTTVNYLRIESIVANNLELRPKIKNEMIVKGNFISKQRIPNKINNLSFFMVSSSSQDIIIEDCEVKFLSIANTTFRSNTSFKGISISEEFNMSNLIAGSTAFVNIKMKDAGLKLSHSDISKAVFNDIKWPIGHRLIGHPQNRQKSNLITADDLQTLKESYRQLKWVTKNHSNNIDSLEFYKNEMEIHWWIASNHKSKYERLQNWFIVGWNRFFSNFGQDILKPIALLFLIHLALFLILIGIFPDLNIEYNWITPSWTGLSHAVGQYLFLINPVHPTPIKLPEQVDKSYILIIDSLMRFFSGYCIWHIIKASRKYSGD